MTTDPKTKALPLALKVDNFLIKYRNTPVTTTKMCPNDSIFIFRPKTCMSIMSKKQNILRQTKPSTDQKHIRTTILPHSSNKTQCNVVAKITFQKGDAVLYRSESSAAIKWLRAKVLEKVSSCVYSIKLQSVSR